MNDEIRPVKNGRYSIFDGGVFCRECGHFSYETYDEVTERGEVLLRYPRYCGYCGSRHSIKVENDE